MLAKTRFARTVAAVNTESLPSLRVMTLNLNWHPRSSLVDERADAFGQLLQEHRPDIVCVQEADPARPELLATVAGRYGLAVVASAAHSRAEGFLPPSAVAVLSHLPAGPSHVLTLPTQMGLTRRVAAATLTAPSGRAVLALSAHLCWGGSFEPARQREAQLIDDWCQRLAGPETLTVVCGDLNATPASSTLRYLTGLEGCDGRGAFWVDAWAARGHGPGVTSNPANPGFAETAAQVCAIVYPQHVPERRIDYVLVRGWVYGRPGSPLTAQVCADIAIGPSSVFVSDHYGVVTDLWDPPSAELAAS